MAEVTQASNSLLTSKWGPLPVWAWAGIGLVAAYVYMQWKDNKAAAAAAAQAEDTYPIASTGVATSESQAAAPQFIIQNQIPYIPVPTPPTGVPVVAPPTTAPPVVTPPTTTPVDTTPTTKAPIQYRVKPGDTLSGIAAKYGTSWQALWQYNTTAAAQGGAGRPAATIATLKKRGPNLLYSNELILVPQK